MLHYSLSTKGLPIQSPAAVATEKWDTRRVATAAVYRENAAVAQPKTEPYNAPGGGTKL